MAFNVKVILYAHTNFSRKIRLFSAAVEQKPKKYIQRQSIVREIRPFCNCETSDLTNVMHPIFANI